MCQLTQTALKGFLAQKYKDENDCSDTTELDEDVEAGLRAAKQYVSMLTGNYQLLIRIHRMRTSG